MASLFTHMVYLVLSYLLGSILFCQWLSKWLGAKNLFHGGNHRPDAYNLWHSCSWQAGLFGFILDAGKSFCAVFLAYLFAFPSFILYLAGVYVIVGHVFSLYYRFRGGTGSMPALGFLIALFTIDTLKPGYLPFFTTVAVILIVYMIVVPMVFKLFLNKKYL